MDNSSSFYYRGFNCGFIFYQDMDAPILPEDIKEGSVDAADYIRGYRDGQDEKWELIDDNSFYASLDFQYCAKDK